MKLLTLAFVGFLLSLANLKGQKLIDSGFEPSVRITGSPARITGVDQTTGYDWGTTSSWIQSHRFVYLLGRNTDTTRFQNSRIISAVGPHGNTTRVLEMANIADDPSHSAKSRNELSLFGYTDGSGPQYEQGYTRYWMKLEDLNQYVARADKSPWYMIMEWKEGNTGDRQTAQQCTACCGAQAGGTNNYRIGVYIDKPRHQSTFRWRLQGQQGQPCRKTEWQYTHPSAAVPLGEWFLVEAYMKKHASQGRVLLKINGEVILDTDVTTPEGFVGRTEHATNPLPLKFWSPLKNYRDVAWNRAISQYYDDLEVWETLPDPIPEADPDAIISVTPPAALVPGTTATVQVAYTAAAPRDLYATVQADTAPFTRYGALTRVEVPAGSGTLTINVQISDTIPLAPDAYQVNTFLTPPGGGWADRVAARAEIDLDAVAKLLPAPPDAITAISVPEVVSPGSIASVGIDYQASTERDVWVMLQPDSGPDFTPYQITKAQVAAGGGSLTLNVPVPADLPIATDAYQLQVFITTRGGNWNDRLDYQGQKDVDAVASNTRSGSTPGKPTAGWPASEIFRSYPNPAHGVLTVEGSAPYQVRMYDLGGRSVLEQSHLQGKASLDISKLRPGVYLLKMSDGRHPQLRRRLVVE